MQKSESLLLVIDIPLAIFVPIAIGLVVRVVWRLLELFMGFQAAVFTVGATTDRAQTKRPIKTRAI